MTDFALALDAMGGDNAPDMVVKGASIALQRFPKVKFLLFGDSERLKRLVERTPRLKDACTIHHTDQVVRSDEKPSQALRSGRGSSMRLAINALHEGAASAVVSAGNTGALMAMAKFVLKTMPGVNRPAMASFFPTLRGESVMLDLGANVQCDANNLVQFAIMGNVFARSVLGILHPSIAILNVGSEDQKGHEYLREAAATLRALPLPGRFHGFVEGDDIAKGTVDVVVSDGFAGNVAVKTAEGTARQIGGYLKAAMSRSLLARIGYLFARSAFRALAEKVDPRRSNGGVFLGLNGVVIKSHGGTDGEGFAAARDIGYEVVGYELLAKISQMLVHQNHDTAARPAAGAVS